MAVRCTYRFCDKVFDTEKEMKSHKHHDPNHHYCRKCDYDAVDWDDLLDHKVAAMAPFIIGELRHEKHKKMKHLCCEFCGEDFKSMGGRMEHRRQRHQAAHYIECGGKGLIYDPVTDSMVEGACGQVFMTPSQLIEHLEKGRCQFVDPSQFHAERQRRHILKQILENPELFCLNLESSKSIIDGDAASVVQDDDISSVSGGVALLDAGDMSEVSRYGTLSPRLGRNNFLDQMIDRRDRPGSKGQSQASLQPGQTPRSNGGSISSRWSTSSVASAGVSLGASSSVSLIAVSETDDDDSASTSSGTPSETPTIRGPPAPMGYATSATLSDYISSLPSEHSIDWAALAASRGHPDPAPSAGTNLFTTNWFDPHSAAYDPDLFYHPVLEAYKCPFASCAAHFPTQPAMEAHLRAAHVLASNRCPTCFKTYPTVAGLVRHFEASVRGSRCWVADSDAFARLLADVSGGFLEAFHVGRGREEKLAGVVHTGSDTYRIERVGAEIGDGVTTMRFEAGRAAGWESRAPMPPALEAPTPVPAIEGRKAVMW